MAWTYNQNFDAMNDGGINGQDSWSGDSNTTIQGSVYQGASGKALKIAADGSNRTASRSIDATTSGNVVFYVRASKTGGNGMKFRDSSTKFQFEFVQNSDQMQLYTSQGYLSLGSFSADTWYKIEIQYDFVAGTCKIRINDGSWSETRTCDTGSATGIQVTTNDGGNAGDYYFDTLYDATPPATSIKSVAGVAYASIKKITGVAIASVKKIIGLS